jgi:type IV secretion system protein VirB9
MRVAASAFVLLLAACSSLQKPPVIVYDTPTPAHVESDPPKPVQIVEVPQPLPLPGQLKPRPSSTPEPSDHRPPAERIAAANSAARIEPNRNGFIDAVQVWPYHPGALYQLYAAMGEVSDITLEPGEELSGDPAGGDTERWEVGSAVSGAGASRQVHLLIKPKRPDLSANLVITTNRRTYHLELHSTAQATSKPATYMAAVSWDYPLDLKWKLDQQNAQATDQAAASVDEQIDLQHMHHRYKITGDSVPWHPVDVWDDEHKVYIQMPPGLAQGDAPPLFIIGPKGDGELVNYRVRGNWYVVDRLFGAAELRLGSNPQQTVRISRTDGIASK